MVDIQSKEVIDKMSEDLKVQPSMALPRALVNNIQPTYQVNPKIKLKVVSANLSDSATGVIHTTAIGKRTFLHGVAITVAKDVVATSLFSFVNASVLGGLQSNPEAILLIRYQPVTAGEFTDSVMFPHPLELIPATTLNFTHSTNVASIDGTAFIYISEEDPQ